MKTNKLVQDENINIVISRGENGLENFNLSLNQSSVEQSSTLEVMCLGT